MSLEKIEISNFKSYKGTYVIGPFDKFSCIIGPNGSGKSNILEAICFVFNISNSCLRTKHLRSLIAYGETESKIRAYVKDNIFERIISINIHLNKTNEDDSVKCKYIFNGLKISQKQYNEELEKLNIVSRIKNFVIQQGDIINTDIDLLKIIEATCGSDKYKKDYDELNEKLICQNKELNIKYEKKRDCYEMLKEIKETKEKEKKFRILVENKEKFKENYISMKYLIKSMK